MKRNVVLLIKLLLAAILLFLLYVVGCLCHGTYSDFKADEIMQLDVKGSTAGIQVIEKDVLTFANWNVGYGGLGKESNFFYDSGGFLTSKGKMIRAPKSNVEKNIKGAVSFLKEQTVDFYLFQEVDKNSKRSYYINQHQQYIDARKDYAATFAINYKSARVPLPVFEFWRVMGKMESGLGTYMKYKPTQSTRYQFPGNYGWPTRIFQLDRCFALHRFKTKNGKELIVINTHNSAYDDGTLKKQQMEYMRKLLVSEYEKGNYVVVGGDWNQCPPGQDFDAFSPSDLKGRNYVQMNIPKDYLPQDWQWAFDSTVATNRKLTDAYEEGNTFVTLIDFYLVSPNVEIQKTQGVNQNFEYSDHQPVLLTVKLKGF